MMFKKKYDLAIINRSFWPTYPVIGEALLRLAEKVGPTKRVVILSQGEEKLSDLFVKNSRGRNVDASTLLIAARSNMSILRRVFESLLFMFWVFSKLCIMRPKTVYVSTDPPVLVPFIVMIYSKIFRARYVYHLQDIHPEITSVYLGRKGTIFKVVKWLDNLTLKNASKIVVLSSQMEDTIRNRASIRCPIEVVDNPSIDLNVRSDTADPKALVFCGNAGRLQRIPLLINAIRAHYAQGGGLKFHFVGSGVFSNELLSLSEEFENVIYHGFLPPKETAKIVINCTWGLLPIDDEVTKFAFPSKSSTYAASGLSIIAICGEESSVGQWIRGNSAGFLIEPNTDALVKCFTEIDENILKHKVDKNKLQDIRQRLSFDRFVDRLEQITEY